MLEYLLTLSLLLPLGPGDEPFPASTALAEGVSPAALERLSDLVQSFVDDDEVVGAELLVIKNGRTVLHEARGWRDREAEEVLAVGSVFCVRSMTKPVVGTAVLMLIDDDALELDDRVAQYLPAFDVDGLRPITVEQLLGHTSGLPMSLILARDLRALDGIQAVAALADGSELGFEPGSAFHYSDQGTDTLTALIEVVSGMPAAEFVRTRVLEPLGMEDSTCVMTEGHPLRARALDLYVGSPGEWTRFWRPEDPPLFPFFLGSQGLYSTLTDYARFMEFWRRRGRGTEGRILDVRLAKKAFVPGPHPMRAATGFPGLQNAYGYLMQLWTEGEGSESEVVAFGHTGSDGTHAWVFPEQNAMVLYFTQSRGNTTGLRVEEALGELFLGAPFDPNQVAPPFEPYLGYYWEGEGDLYRAIVRDGEDLALEIMGQGVVPLNYAGEDRWKFRANPSVVLAFDRAEDGSVTGYHIGEHQEFRFEPSADLPGADELAARVAETHRMDLLAALGPVRLSGSVAFEGRDDEGETSLLFEWPERWREDSVFGGEFEHVAFDGEQVWYEAKGKSVAALEGVQAEVLSRSGPLARFGDWRRTHARLEVIQQLERGGRQVFLVRTGDTSAPARTLYVDAERGRVLREEGLTFIPTLGRIGQRLTFGDYRDVSGMLLPFRTEIEYPNPMIPTLIVEISVVEEGVAVPAGTFQLLN